MEFTINRSVFLDGIQRTLGIVEKRTTIPILNNVLLQASDNLLRIVATDREIGLSADYAAQVVTQGEITVQAKKLHEMIREIDGEDISWKSRDNNWIDITCGKVAFRVPGIGAEEFPSFEYPDDAEFFEMPPEYLLDMIGKTFFAISLDDMRPALGGACFTVNAEIMEMAATDGHRLALLSREEKLVTVGTGFERIIIPRKGIVEMRKLIEAYDNRVLLGVYEKSCFVKTDHSILRINLIDSEYPDYMKVVPKDEGASVIVDKNQILHSLRRMSVMSSDRFSGVKIRIENGKMYLDSTNPDVGEAHDEIDIEYSGSAFEIGYNVRYLIDAIEVIEDDSLCFEMRTNNGPGVVRSIDDKGYQCIVMPIKLLKE